MANRLSRRAIASHVAARLASGDTNVLMQLAAHLVDTRRTSEVDLIVRDIEAALQQLGVVVADVTSARSLSADVTKQISRLIQTATGATDVQLRPHIDESLIGGVRIETPGADYDTSVRRQLTKLQAMKV